MNAKRKKYAKAYKIGDNNFNFSKFDYFNIEKVFELDTITRGRYIQYNFILKDDTGTESNFCLRQPKRGGKYEVAVFESLTLVSDLFVNKSLFMDIYKSLRKIKEGSKDNDLWWSCLM